MLNHPVSTMAVAGGSALAAVGAAGLAGGTALSATGVGAVAGVPLGGASAAGVAAGAGLAGAGMIDLALNAATNDRVQPFRVDTDADATRVSTAGGATADRIRSIGEPGLSRRVREVETEDEVRQLYDELAEDGEPIVRPTYDGTWVRTPDGAEIGVRNSSGSGGATLDAVLPNGERWKVHLPK